MQKWTCPYLEVLVEQVRKKNEIVVILGQNYFMRASWIIPGQGQMQEASMKLSISALSCSGYRVGGVLGLPPFCFSRLLPFVSDGKDGIPLFHRKRYLFLVWLLPIPISGRIW